MIGARPKHPNILVHFLFHFVQSQIEEQIIIAYCLVLSFVNAVVTFLVEKITDQEKKRKER
ncbi:MAG: hypothetical protein ACI8RD_002162 [Bacillariaceae sp.]|jgi:hypothetical protein